MLPCKNAFLGDNPSWKRLLQIEQVLNSNYSMCKAIVTSLRHTQAFLGTAIDSLPRDLQLYLRNYLNPKSLLSLGCTNTTLYKWTSENELWRDLCKSTFLATQIKPDMASPVYWKEVGLKASKQVIKHETQTVELTKRKSELRGCLLDLSC